MSKAKLFIIILFTAVCSILGTLIALLYLFGFDETSAAELARFFSAKTYIETRYVDAVDEHTLMDGAISGMVASLGDPHSMYLNKDNLALLKNQTNGTFGGIGVTLGFMDGGATVISVMEGSPGETAGLRAGDEIIAVDGESVETWQPEEIVLHIRGEKGTEVALTFLRDGEPMEVTLTRDIIHYPTAKGTMIEGTEMGYLRIASFAENTGEEFREELTKLESAGMKGLIIDLRQNPGGLLTACVEVAQRVVPKGTIVSVEDRAGKKEVFESALTEQKYPIVVLVDGYSASAAEILAGALQDTGAGTLVGEKTYGKGSVQTVAPMGTDTGLKLTIAKYYTPSGKCIDGTGLTPDIEIALPKDATEDVQLEKAKEVLAGKLAEN